MTNGEVKESLLSLVLHGLFFQIKTGCLQIAFARLLVLSRECPTLALNSTVELPLNCTSPDPGMHQRDNFVDESMEDLVNFDQSGDNFSPARNRSIEDEAEQSVESPTESSSSDLSQNLAHNSQM